MQFVDNCKIYVKAGNGGDGIVSWRREKSVPEGGPDGGNGGKGGDVIIIGDHNKNTLFDLRNKKNIVAKNGERGGNQKSSGHDGKTEYIPVPLGTTVYDDKGNVIVDILHDNESYVICHGGNGGHGNAFFKSSFNRIPSLHERGDIGEEKNIELQIRYMADIGLVGLPNAGKSTLISKVSNASPKIANYQFTTLSPVLGTVKINNDTLVFEDVPGLIEGASDGKGLGKKFLKHIERCYILIHLISLSKNDNEDIVGAYNTIINELQQYSSYVSEKKIILVGNKIDTDDFQDNLQKLEKYLNKKIFTISAKEKTNVDNLLKLIYDDYHNILVELKKQSSQENVVLVNDVKYDAETLTDKLIRATTVKKTGDRIYTVYSQYLDYWFNKIPLDTNDNIIRFNQKIETSKAENMAKKIGAVPGDTLIICGTEFTIE